MKRFYFISVLILFQIVTGCRIINPSSEKTEQDVVSYYNSICVAKNGIYYWKTVYNLTAGDSCFMKRHEVERMYLRLFDVHVNSDADRVDPVATLMFKQPMPADCEIVPTVYITIEALRYMIAKDEIKVYAEKIAERIRQMLRYNDILNVREVQFDCDWTKSTQDYYFELLEFLRDLLAKQGKIVSATIRLWQLGCPVPPVDKGVLMCYNTGAVMNPDTYNSIIDLKDVTPYLGKLKEYRLPLDVAYPAFGWTVWFRDNRFKALIRSAHLTDSLLYQHLGGNKYKVLKNHYLDTKYLMAGDVLRVETSDWHKIWEVKQAVEPRLRYGVYSVILYHLDYANLKRYENHEIDSIYMH